MASSCAVSHEEFSKEPRTQCGGHNDAGADLLSPTTAIRSAIRPPGLPHEVRHNVCVEEKSHRLEIDLAGRKIVDPGKLFLKRRETREDRQERLGRCRLNNKPLAVLTHDCLFSRQLELARNPHRLVSTILEKLHKALSHAIIALAYVKFHCQHLEIPAGV